jgi:peptide-methionine (S)-S-oxide reductase
VEILPFKRFYAAEDYHQKYYLQQNGGLVRELGNAYPKMGELLNSTAAARLNAYLAGNLSLEKLHSELARTELLQPVQDAVVEIASGSARTAAH